MSRKKNLFISIVSTILSRGIGFLRTLVETTLLGLGMFSDSYMAAFRLTNFFRELFGEGAMAGAFIPVYSKIKHEKSEKLAYSFFFFASIFVFLLSCSIYLLLNFFLEDILKVWLIDFTPQKIDTTKNLATIMLPYLVFISLASMFLLLHQIKEKFFYSSIHPILFSFSIIVFGITNPLSHHAKSLALGLMIGGLLQLLLLIFTIKTPLVSLSDFQKILPYLKKMSLLLIPVIFSLMVSRINRLIDLSFASGLLSGSLSSLVYATVLINVPLGFIGVATNNVIFPVIAKLKASKKHNQFQKEVIEVFYYLSFIGIPVSIFLYLFSYDICKVLFIEIPKFLSIKSMFDQAALSLLASSLKYYSPALLSLLLLPFVIKIFHSCSDTKTPALITLFGVIINIVLNFYFTPIWQNKGIAGATTIASYAQLFLLILFLSKKNILLFSKKTFISSFQILLFCFLLIFICEEIHSSFSPLPELFLFFIPLLIFHLFQKNYKK
ncbi:MAG: murein biosynthesis integral membrane protein MurJ [Candidatus Cloacimonadota bacterium]|nr:MAG: murein biosynthesis integral membrane protein MurJ [Candidatus Cloacimonadota bacterium]